MASDKKSWLESALFLYQVFWFHGNMVACLLSISLLVLHLLARSHSSKSSLSKNSLPPPAYCVWYGEGACKLIKVGCLKPVYATTSSNEDFLVDNNNPSILLNLSIGRFSFVFLPMIFRLKLNMGTGACTLISNSTQLSQWRKRKKGDNFYLLFNVVRCYT